MLINFKHLKTFYNALIQKIKGFRGDWEQNDPTADDYIKNKPFYSEGFEEKELVAETSYDFDRTNMISNPFSLSLVAGHTYTVIFDGITYETVAKKLDDQVLFIGNSSLGYDSVNTNEPFFVVVQNVNDGPSQVAFFARDYAIHTISISTQVEVVHKLDKKFIDIPNGVVTEERVNELIVQALSDIPDAEDLSV